MLKYDLSAAFQCHSFDFSIIFSLFSPLSSLSLYLSPLSLSISLSLSLVSLSFLSSFSSLPCTSLAYPSFSASISLSYISLSHIFACSFLSYSHKASPSSAVFGSLSFGALLFRCYAKSTSKAGKTGFPPEMECFGGFSLGCSGIEKLEKKENPKKGGVGVWSPTQHSLPKILLCFLCSLHVFQQLCFVFLFLIDHYQKILVGFFLRPFEKHKLLTSVILCFSGCFATGRSWITTLGGNKRLFLQKLASSRS